MVKKCVFIYIEKRSNFEKLVLIFKSINLNIIFLISSLFLKTIFLKISRSKISYT